LPPSRGRGPAPRSFPLPSASLRRCAL
jgi:hypothetical protein